MRSLPAIIGGEWGRVDWYHLFSAAGAGIAWAVVDSGIDAAHPHFRPYNTLGDEVAQLHRDFTLTDVDYAHPSDADLKKMIDGAQIDSRGHGTHVAGIIAGSIHKDGKIPDGLRPVVGQRADGPAGIALAVESVMLLQGAFSHFAFADKLPQDPSRGGALKGMAARVDGPICVTHSLKDTAVGTAYPLASLAARDDAAALGDPLYRWGAMGHDGAQAVGAAQTILGQVGTKYSFGVGSFLNLDANQVITQGGPPSGAHSDIVHPQIAWALLSSARVVT